MKETQTTRPIRSEASAPSCLIVHSRRQLRTYDPVTKWNAVEREPRHPHTGPGLAQYLREHGVEVAFSDQLGPRRLHAALHRSPESWLTAVASLPWAHRFDAVICDSAVGSLEVVLTSMLLGDWPATILIALSHPNPEGRCWKATARGRVFYSAARRASAVVYALKELGEIFAGDRWCSVDRLFYAPTCVDSEFFDPARARAADRPSGLPDGPFLLAVGDSSRDDSLLYRALTDNRTPLVRVTRDASVVKRVKPLLDNARGDRLLSQISFEELRWLYATCAACVFTSRLDRWQASGSTALTEAMACGAVCVANGGGCLEREWRHLAGRAGLECPVIFYPPGSTDELRAAVARGLSERDKRAQTGGQSREMALRAFPIERSYKAITAALRRALVNCSRFQNSQAKHLCA